MFVDRYILLWALISKQLQSFCVDLLRFIVTDCSYANCTETQSSTKGIPPDHLLAYKYQGSDAIGEEGDPVVVN
jgi:hypothetical protein